MDEPVLAVTTAGQVADLLEAVMTANGHIAAEAARIAESDLLVSQAMVDRLTSLGQRLRPGAEARTRLAAAGPQLLLAGTAVWLTRRQQGTGSAAQRAHARWSGPAA
mgnify:CR=1 FL=1|jgi:hypothetical protein